MDEIIANVDDEDLSLPAAPSADAVEDCKDCAIEHCSWQRIKCQKDKACEKLLKCKAEKPDPEGLDSCGSQVNESVKRKYQDYFDCVFLNQRNECPNRCKAGMKLSCTGPDDLDSGVEEGSIYLTININQIKDMWVERRMTSPGEHCVCVQWVDVSNGYQEEDCTPQETRDCESGKLLETSPTTKGYTDGYGEVILSIPRSNKGYLKIVRGYYNGSEPLTYYDLGPFIYYLGRRLITSQEVTLYLPQRAFEEKWVKDYYNGYHENEEWFFSNGGIITIMSYDCVGAPVRDFSFVLNGLLEDQYYEVRWNEVEGESLIKFDGDINRELKTRVQGITSFIYSGVEEDKIVTLSSPEEESVDTSDYEIKIRNNSTTFVVLYPYSTLEN